jgi:hypothetical protein
LFLDNSHDIEDEVIEMARKYGVMTYYDNRVARVGFFQVKKSSRDINIKMTEKKFNQIDEIFNKNFNRYLKNLCDFKNPFLSHYISISSEYTFGDMLSAISDYIQFQMDDVLSIRNSISVCKLVDGFLKAVMIDICKIYGGAQAVILNEFEMLDIADDMNCESRFDKKLYNMFSNDIKMLAQKSMKSDSSVSYISFLSYLKGYSSSNVLYADKDRLVNIKRGADYVPNLTNSPGISECMFSK